MRKQSFFISNDSQNHTINDNDSNFNSVDTIRFSTGLSLNDLY